MSDIDPNLSDDCDDELKQALTAAFGDDAMDLLEESDLDEIPDELLLAATATMDNGLGQDNGHTPVHDCSEEISRCLTPAENDSSRDRWVKEVCRAIYLPDENTVSNTDQADADAEAARYLIFSIGEHQFAIPLSDVREIAHNPKITTIPGTAAWLRGATNLRGQILSVTDLRNLLQIDCPRPVIGEKIIVIHSEHHALTTGLLVDRVIGIRNVSDEQNDISELSPIIASVAGGLATVEQSTTVLIDSEQLLGCRALTAYV